MSNQFGLPEYSIVWQSKKIPVRVLSKIFSSQLGRLLPIPQRPVQDAAYHRGFVWIPLPTLEGAFSYHRDILEPILTLTLRAHSHAHSTDEKNESTGQLRRLARRPSITGPISIGPKFCRTE
jgi:hypothetical protein